MSKNLSKTLLMMIISISTRIINSTNIKNSIKSLQQLQHNTHFQYQKNKKKSFRHLIKQLVCKPGGLVCEQSRLRNTCWWDESWSNQVLRHNESFHCVCLLFLKGCKRGNLLRKRRPWVWRMWWFCWKWDVLLGSVIV